MRARSTRRLFAACVCALLAGGLLATTTGSAVAAPPYGAVISAQQAKLVASDGAEFDNLGGSVALSGDTAIVGAPFDDGTAGADQGAAHVWTRTGATWAAQPKLVADDAAASDAFGQSVAISGDTAVVGAMWDDGAAGFDQGAAYVFTRSGTTWTQQAKLLADDAALVDQFGQAVAISGDTIVVGTPGDDAPGTGSDRFNQGSAYVFTRTGTTWTQQAKLVADDAALEDWFGSAVAVAGDTAVIGVASSDPADQGGAYVYARTGTTWIQQQKLLPADPAAGDYFGYSVAVSDTTALVGAPRDDTAPVTNHGSAYAFTRTGATWTQQAKLLPTDLTPFGGFGWSIAYDSDTAVMGAVFDTGPAGEQGSAYVFNRSGATWAQQSNLLASDGAEGDSFGQSVAVSTDTVLVGAWADDGTGGSDQGSAYVFVPGAFSVSDATVQEGTGGATNLTFTVTRTGTLSNPAYVEASTLGGSAVSGVDFDATAATLSFVPGVASQTFTVPIEPDSLNEANEIFSVALSSPSGALIGDGFGRGTITDDDDPSTLTITAPAPVTETDASTVPVNFTVARSGSTGGAVSVEVHTSDGTAKAIDDDYTPTARTLRWANGEIGNRTFTVMVEPDNITESVERFFARLSRAVGADIVAGYARATINDDDVVAGPSLAINDPTILEANSGTKNIVFKITRTGSTASATTFNFATANGTAIAPGDYTAKTGTATIAAGATFVNVVVVTKGDVANEANEAFTLTISNASGGATISKAVGTGTITDND